ncbi:Hpt domain-containing protein [Butyrivibrio sp. XPD2002]|uniref:Hpt domain-containing protein n=1 Tax=Butyrivibrio sp. XPD2002 TaxID=1280665 RepID=UPI0003FFF73D|nr:Hpt domain-containing protein [Butyrivibrio sp. XPD2002]
MEKRIIESLNNIDGISVKEGLAFCGTEKVLLKYLNGFYSSIDNKADEIENAYKCGDVGYYTTKVHSLKSTSKVIGAHELSELALKLEQAGKNEDVECIDANTDKLLKMFRSYSEKLSVLEDINSDINCDKRPIDEEELKEACKTLAEAVSSMDYDAAEIVLDELKKCKLSVKDSECIKNIEKALQNFDWDEMGRILETK